MAKKKEIVEEEIEFSTEMRLVNELVPCEYNPRVLTEKQFDELKASFKKFNYVELCVINTDNTILAGHQRIKVMFDLGWKDKEIEVRVPNQFLTKEDFDEYLLRSNKNGGDFDFDVLANCFELDKLYEIGFVKTDFDMGDWDSDLDDGPDDAPKEPEDEIIKIQIDLGKRTEIIPVIKLALSGYNVKIL